MAFILRQYSSVLKRWPVTVQAVQSGALMGVGDLLAQTLVEGRKAKEVDWKRMSQFASVGFLVVGPPLRVWYGVLDRFVVGNGGTLALKKMAVDQLLFAPVFIVVVMTSIGLAQGQPLSEVKSRLSHDYKDVLTTNYKVWPAVQLCNFYLVPLQYQVLIAQVVAVFWNTYLSWKSNSALTIEEPVR